MSEYHEPEGEITAEVRDEHRALTSLKEEIEAIDWYNQRWSASKNESLRAVLAHNRDEEIEHACMTLEWLRRNMPKWDEVMRTYLFTEGPITEVEEKATGKAADGGAASGGDLGIGGTPEDAVTDLLRRHQAPIAAASWQAIDEQAREVLTGNLSGRKVVDVSGPFGWEHASVNVGRLEPGRVDAGNGVLYGIRKVLPLVEVRVPFTLELWELDDVVRGARDPDLDPLIEAAAKLAAFEERAIYFGFEPGGIVGMAKASQHERVALPRDPKTWPQAIAHAIVALKTAGEPPPYTLVAGRTVFQALEREAGQYPLRKQIESLIDGTIVLAPMIEGAFLLPIDSEGDFELTLGQDVSVGYEQQEGQRVKLYLTESFTFRVLEPQAVVAFESS